MCKTIIVGLMNTVIPKVMQFLFVQGTLTEGTLSVTVIALEMESLTWVQILEVTVLKPLGKPWIQLFSSSSCG